jgi:serine/threonine protein kinase
VGFIRRLHTKSTQKVLRSSIQLSDSEKPAINDSGVVRSGSSLSTNGSVIGFFTGNKDKIVVSIKKTRLLNPIADAPGSGTSIYNCQVDGFSCACKQLLLPQAISADIVSFEAELEMLETLPSHPNLLRYLFHERNGAHMRMYLTLYSGNLRTYIDTIQRPKGLWQPKEVCKFATQISAGLLAIHRDDIIHRDLKAANILYQLGPNSDIDNLVISDFDSAKKGKRCNSLVGTPSWMAPELFQGEVYSFPVDVFAFGMILFELITLDIPYSKLKTWDVPDAICGGVPPALPPGDWDAYEPLFAIMRDCISFEPEERPTASALSDRFEKLQAALG